MTRSLRFSYPHVRHEAHAWAAAAAIGQLPSQQILQGGSTTWTDEEPRIRGPEFTSGQPTICFVGFNSHSSRCKVAQSSYLTYRGCLPSNQPATLVLKQKTVS